MTQPFYKMTGSGNDFVFVDGRESSVDDWPAERIAAICDRRTGVGADGLVVVSPDASGARMIYFNADGSRAGMCGNAALCSTRLAARLGFAGEAGMELHTDTGLLRTRCVGPGWAAELLLPDFHLSAPLDLPLGAGESWMELGQVGVPHLVIHTGDLAGVDVQRRGKALRDDPAFSPAGLNVNFIGALPDDDLSWRLRTYERGVEAETLACGTGTVAAAFALAQRGLDRLPIRIRSWGGNMFSVAGRIEDPGGRGSHGSVGRAGWSSREGSSEPMRGVGRRILVQTLLALSVAACGDSPTSSLPPAEYWPAGSWRRAVPDSVGIDGAAIADLVQRLRSNEIPDLHSLLIVRRGYLAVEEYFNGSGSGEYHTIQSVTKSVTSLLAGIAVGQGVLSLDRTITSWFPEYQNLLNDDARKQAMTLLDLLTMRSGFEWVENDYATSDIKKLNDSGTDWLRYMLDWPMRDQPGTRFYYNSGNAVLAGGVIRRAVGTQLDAFAEARLFTPLGIGSYYWFKGPPDQLAHAGGGLYLRAQDMARIGYLVLRGGRWDDTQVISPQWLQASLTPSVLRPERFAGYPVDYGYFWWLFPLDGQGATGDPNETIYTAAGIYGQYIFVVPRYDLVVVVTGETDDANSPVHFLFDDIIPAIH